MAHQLMATCRSREHAKFLVGQKMPLDPIAVQNAGMGCQARQDRRTRVALRPVKYLREQVPVTLLPQIGILRLRSCDDDAVKPMLPEVIEWEVKAVQMPLASVSARYACQRIELDINGQIARSDVQQFEELELGIFKSGIGHVVDEGELQPVFVP